ncbi:CIC_collapsed_G0031800.mRNA.1.CDS.1 [Saccharomyces cerevisiae]|nr:CIC_collapsed_G0031800.mRNA.1.CDS.1 [Saccharomyces cerevisiae]
MVNSHGIRYIRLKQVFNRALDQSISKLQSWDKVSSCFPQYVNSKAGRYKRRQLSAPINGILDGALSTRV